MLHSGTTWRNVLVNYLMLFSLLVEKAIVFCLSELPCGSDETVSWAVYSLEAQDLPPPNFIKIFVIYLVIVVFVETER